RLPRCISLAARIRSSRSLSGSSRGRISPGSSGQCAWGPERACVLTWMFRSWGAQTGSTRGAWNCKRTRRAAKSRVEGDNKKGHRTKTSCGCPMLRNRSLQKQFRSEVSDHGALDIEDLAQIGRKVGTCPYYGARDMVRSADLVVLPYQSLLLKSARESLGLNLKNSVVIIDEAHNLADSLTSMYNSKVTSSQVLRAVLSHLEAYLNRFQNVLGAGNRRYIQTLTVLTRSFLRCLISNEDCSSAVTSLTINKFLFSLDIDNINIVKLCQYLKESNIIHKVKYFFHYISIQSCCV
uniref:Helicase ATP-binding domain-containing protein n=1 Tax=Aegilops tauschii subsp. strangulata TaxID=200361 RepID=A0A453A0G5_AEGTS